MQVPWSKTRRECVTCLNYRLSWSLKSRRIVEAYNFHLSYSWGFTRLKHDVCSHAHEAAPKAGDVTHPSTSWDMMIGKLILTSWTIYHARHLRTGELRSCCFCLCLFILPVIAEPHSYGVFCLPIFFTYVGILVHHTTVCGELYRQSGLVNTSIFITLHHSETNKMTSQERGMIPHEAKGLVNTHCTALHCTAAREEAALEKGRGFFVLLFFFLILAYFVQGTWGRWTYVLHCGLITLRCMDG